MNESNIRTLEDVGLYFSQWCKNNIDAYNINYSKLDSFLKYLKDKFCLTAEQANYVRSRCFVTESQSNEATLALARMASEIQVSCKGNG